MLSARAAISPGAFLRQARTPWRHRSWTCKWCLIFRATASASTWLDLTSPANALNQCPWGRPPCFASSNAVGMDFAPPQAFKLLAAFSENTSTVQYPEGGFAERLAQPRAAPVSVSSLPRGLRAILSMADAHCAMTSSGWPSANSASSLGVSLSTVVRRTRRRLASRVPLGRTPPVRFDYKHVLPTTIHRLRKLRYISTRIETKQEF